MADVAQLAESAGHRYAALRAHLDERQRRLVLGIEATELGRGGITAIAAVTGVHPDTIARGVREITGEAEPAPRVRAPGGGRKPLSETDPELAVGLKALVDPVTRGDPMSPLVWTTKSTRHLADALTTAGHPVSDRTVARMLRNMGFSPAGQRQGLRGHPARRPGRPVHVPGRAGPGVPRRETASPYAVSRSRWNQMYQQPP